MVGVVQLAEHRIVVPGVVGSSPITHPRKEKVIPKGMAFFFSIGIRGNGTQTIANQGREMVTDSVSALFLPIIISNAPGSKIK